MLQKAVIINVTLLGKIVNASSQDTHVKSNSKKRSKNKTYSEPFSVKIPSKTATLFYEATFAIKPQKSRDE